MEQLFSLTVLFMACFSFSSKKINMKNILPNVFDFERYSFFVPSNSPRQPKLKSSFPSPPLSPLFLYFRSSSHSKLEKVPIVFLWPHFFELSILRTLSSLEARDSRKTMDKELKRVQMEHFDI